jgi:hypothetical protein
MRVYGPLVMVCGLMASGTASAQSPTVEDCNGAHAPSSYYNATCHSVCTFGIMGTFSCSTGASFNPATVYVVEDHDSASKVDYTASSSM